MSDLAIGQTVELADGRIAVVRYIGQPHFAAGEWVGVELEDDSGKNDGSVQGERYFDCEMGRGMFVRPAAATIIAQPAPVPKPVAKKPVRPQSTMGPVRQRLSLADGAAGKRMSMNAASPSPATKARPGSMLRSPTKSPTKQLGSGATTGASSRSGTPASRASSTARPSIGGNRTSMAPPPKPANRLSRQPAPTTSGRPTGGLGRTSSSTSSLTPRASARPGQHRLSSIGSHVSSGQASEGSGPENGGDDNVLSDENSEGVLSPTDASPVLSRTAAIEKNTSSPAAASRGGTSPAAQRSTAPSTAASREVEDLKTKLRMMEKKRMEDRDKLKNLEKVQSERDKFEGIIQKLQAKYQPQQQEMTDLRKQLHEFASRFENIENMQSEHDMALEMATLDREMAEETAEVLKGEVEALKQKNEELELEVEVLREENEELGQEMSPEEKTSQGWLQMERNNDRLREALLRLRDLTQQQEAELQDQIKTLEEDLQDLGGVKDQLDLTKDKLEYSEAAIEDLRQQLDNALGAEDMIEELTDRNMSMSEQIEELKAVIDDLESLKELNDELEVNHVETEKEMQEDLDFKDVIINEQARRATQQDETLEDMEYTLSKFRELVTNLQSDLEDMRASHAMTETESEQLTNKSRAMMDLNMKLQLSAAKTQVKTIDLELRRLDAQEASEHLAIVQLFLPESFHADRDSVLALLRFKRVGFKANLLHGFVKERVSGQPPSGHEDDIFYGCDVLDKLSWVTAMCDRFVNAISHCSVEQFVRFEGAMYELEPVERALNGWIDGLRRDELKEKQCADELKRTIALMSHLAEVHIANGLESYADDVHMSTLVMQSHLESAAAAVTAVRAMVQANVPAHEEDEDAVQHFVKKADAAISQARSAKVIAGKAARSLEDLKARSLSLMPDTKETFDLCETNTEELASFSRRIGEDLFSLLHDEARAEPCTYDDVTSTVSQTSSAVFAASESDLFSTFMNKLRIITNSLTDLAALTSDLEVTQEFERAPAPWVLRSQDLRSSKTITIDTEEELRRLKDDLHDRARTIALRDQTLEESAVKIELLESRMRDAAKKNERINELEKKIEEAQHREDELAEIMEARDKELAGLEADREKWKKAASETRTTDIVPGSNAGQEKAVATAREMEALKTEIKSLQAAVRFLREDNQRTRFNHVQNMDWLKEPLAKPKSAKDERKELLVKEGNDVLNELLGLAANAKVYDLSQVPKDRLKWRPAKSTSGYHVAKQREEWAAWKDWSGDVTRRSEILGTDGKRRIGQGVAQIKMQMPSKTVGGGEVRIVVPGEFEEFKEMLGVV